MSLLDNLLGAGNSNIVSQLAQQFGLNGGQMQGLLGQLAPALSSGFMNKAQQNGQSGTMPDNTAQNSIAQNSTAQNNGQNGNGLSSLFNLFQADKPGPTIDQEPHIDQLRSPEAVQSGNSILSQIFGSKDVSREVASSAAEKTGIGANIIKQALPIIAILAASSLYKKFNQSNDNVQGGTTGSSGLLSQFLAATSIIPWPSRL